MSYINRKFWRGDVPSSLVKRRLDGSWLLDSRLCDAVSWIITGYSSTANSPIMFWVRVGKTKVRCDVVFESDNGVPIANIRSAKSSVDPWYVEELARDIVVCAFKILNVKEVFDGTLEEKSCQKNAQFNYMAKIRHGVSREFVRKLHEDRLIRKSVVS